MICASPWIAGAFGAGSLSPDREELLGPRRTIPPRVALAAVALATGAALLVHVLAGISFQISVGAAITLIVVVFVWAWTRLPPPAQHWLGRSSLVGGAAGFVATLGYDASRSLIVAATQPAIAPFEAISQFGRLLTSPDASPAFANTVGVIYHLTNGTLFGVAFAIFVRRPTVLKGVAWAVVLETLTVSIYPGWLGIQALNEFLALSALGHAVYGSVLGASCAHWLRRPADPSPPAGWAPRPHEISSSATVSESRPP